jgi:fructose 1,6-bisphosphate aldolase/phosphatase
MKSLKSGFVKITLSAIKADIGSVGGHTRPSEEVLKTVEEFVSQRGGLYIDKYIGSPEMTYILFSRTQKA